MESTVLGEMLLAIDIGNTNLVGGVFSGAELVETFRFETVRAKTADEYAVLLSELLRLRGVERDSVSACILASVVPPMTDVVVSAIEQIGPKGDYPYRVVFDIPHRQQDAWLPAGGIMRDGRLLPSHENWPPVQQAATGRTLPVITRATVGRQAPAAAIPDQPQVRQPEPQAPPAKKPLSDQHLSYATER